MAQVIQLAMREGRQPARAAYPEADDRQAAATARPALQPLATAGAGALLGAAAVLWGLRERRTAASGKEGPGAVPLQRRGRPPKPRPAGVAA